MQFLGSLIGGFLAKLASWAIGVFAVFRAGEGAQRAKDTETTVKTLDAEAQAGAKAKDTSTALGDGSF